GKEPAVPPVLAALLGLLRAQSWPRLIPPSRASAWRLGFSSPVDYNDNEGYCGGFQAQWMKNGGKCGICGDAWDQPPPRNHERPDGKFVIKSKDFILSRFREGDSIAVNLEITAAHRGYFEFHLCKVDDLPGQVDATVECLEKTVLRLAGTGETRVAAPVSGAQAYA
ncbi:uncharacterized protein LOC112558112, partial [Pomacea canaliculata]|uniref:uncharacterized protein LOC112558112 n=1 Tax=Pomacea canaliculata TaxID=400727 RepID=UPI000D7254C8